MARFDVHRLRDGAFVVDCQAEFLRNIGTRLVIPLLPRGEGPAPNERINPVIDFHGEPLVLLTQLAGSIRTSELQQRLGSVGHEDLRITSAIDVLTGTA